MVKKLILLLLLAGFTQAINIDEGVYIGVYTLKMDSNVTFVYVNDTMVNITNNPDIECWGESNGVWVNTSGVNGGDCLLSNIDSDNLYLTDVVNFTSAITVFNISGNQTNLTYSYNSTGGGNLTFYLLNLSGECNYASNDSFAKYIMLPINTTYDFKNCTLLVALNGSVVGYSRASMDYSSDVSQSAFLTAIGTLTALVLVKYYQWDSTT